MVTSSLKLKQWTKAVEDLAEPQAAKPVQDCYLPAAMDRFAALVDIAVLAGTVVHYDAHHPLLSLLKKK
jgi:hypothetical protein